MFYESRMESANVNGVIPILNTALYHISFEGAYEKISYLMNLVCLVIIFIIHKY